MQTIGLIAASMAGLCLMSIAAPVVFIGSGIYWVIKKINPRT